MHLPFLLESLIKGCLDPNIPFAIRDRLVGGVTGVLHEMIRQYPTISFHTQSQRLAIATAASVVASGSSSKSGQIIIWDLKTATRLQVIDAHTPHAISAISFNRHPSFSKTGSKSSSNVSQSHNGELLLVSYAAAENLVKVWHQSSGLFGALAGTFSGENSDHNRSFSGGSSSSGGGMSGLFANIITGGSFRMFRSFPVDPYLPASRRQSTDKDEARFEWTSERSVKLLRTLPANTLTFTV